MMKALNPLRLNRSQLPKLLITIGLLAASCLAGLTPYTIVRQTALLLSKPGGFLAPSVAQGQNTSGTPQAVGVGATQVMTQTTIAPSTNPWSGAGRVTVLMLGLDYRDWAANEGPSRSDTMILLTLDPTTKTAGMLSIPRDLWVSIPGFKSGKINTAYYLGDAYKLPGGGPALAVKTVEQFLGVPINYYAQVDFSAFVKFIDELGGVKIDVPAPIVVDLLGTGFKTKKTLPAGKQVLPGEWALAYARARYTDGGDFDRASRQQQVIMAIRDRFLSLDMLSTLIQKAPTLYSELASGVNTNLSLDEVIKLALTAQSVPSENIQRGIIDKESVLFGTSPDNLSILIPIPDDIRVLRDQIFTASGALGPKTPGNAQEQMKAEQARIAIFDGSQTQGLGQRTADYLTTQGVSIVQISGAGQSYAATTIILRGGFPFTLKYLVDLMHIREGKFFIKYDASSAIDVEVYLGDDWAVKNSLP